MVLVGCPCFDEVPWGLSCLSYFVRILGGKSCDGWIGVSKLSWGEVRVPADHGEKGTLLGK